MGRSETALFILIGLLAIWGLCVQLMVRRVVHQERVLTEGDEDRLAEQIVEIEHELVEEYREHQVEEWTADEGETTAEKDAPPDPNEMNSDGEFSVPELSREQQQATFTRGLGLAESVVRAPEKAGVCGTMCARAVAVAGFVGGDARRGGG